MKTFLNIKRIVYLCVICLLLIIMITILIIPIGSEKTLVAAFNFKHGIYGIDSTEPIKNILASPFTTIFGDILLWQTIIFTLVAIVFVVFTVLFVIELKRAKVFTHHTTKTERMQAQIDELQKKVDEMKKGE